MNVVIEEKIGSLHHFCEFNFARLIEPRRRTNHLPDSLADNQENLVPSLEEIESGLVLSRAPLKETYQRDKDRCASRNNPLNNLHHRPQHLPWRNLSQRPARRAIRMDLSYGLRWLDNAGVTRRATKRVRAMRSSAAQTRVRPPRPFTGHRSGEEPPTGEITQQFQSRFPDERSEIRGRRRVSPGFRSSPSGLRCSPTSLREATCPP